MQPGEHLQACPRCTSPSRVKPAEHWAQCSRISCQFSFCVKCLCDQHPKGARCKSASKLPSSSRTPEEASASGNNTINPRLDKLRQRVRKRYDVEGFNSYRRALDPHFVLGNEVMQTLFEPENGSNVPAMDKKVLLERRKTETT